MINTNLLKNCPFCGSDNVSVSNEHHYTVTTPVVFILCNDCKARGGRSMNGDPEEAMKKWNKRTRSIITKE